MIAVYSFKGGVGKSAIALNYALTTGASIVTNDILSPIEKVLPEKKVLKVQRAEAFPELPQGANIVFDLGGYIDQRVKPVLRSVDCVLIPVLAAPADIQIALRSIEEISEFAPRVVVVANRLRRPKNKDFEEISQAVKRFFPDVPVLPLKETRGLINIYNDAASMRDTAARKPLLKRAYGPAIKQFDAIIKAVEG